VTASQKIHESKQLWIAFDETNILTAWCSCMAGAYETCNQIIATLYKMDYANSKGWCNPACTDQPCQWNKSSKKELQPKRIQDLAVRKHLATTSTTSKASDQELRRMADLDVFDPQISSTRSHDPKLFAELLENVKILETDAVIFKCVEIPSLPITISFF